MVRTVRTLVLGPAAAAVVVATACAGSPPVVGQGGDAPAKAQQASPRLAPAGPRLPLGPTPRPAPGTPAGAQVKDTSVHGDPTRLVLPPATGALRPALIFLHGHGMDQTQLTERTGLAEMANREGWIAAAGAFGGRAHWGNEAAQRAVGNLIAALVASHQADPARIYLVGFSMGGGTALLAAANPLGLPYRVAAVASTQGFTDLKAMTTASAANGAYARSIADAYGGGPSDAVFAAHSPQSQAAALVGVPVYLEHGEADRAVPPAHTTAMAAKLAALGHPAAVHLYPGAGHGEQTIAEQAIIGFLRGKQAP